MYFRRRVQTAHWSPGVNSTLRSSCHILLLCKFSSTLFWVGMISEWDEERHGARTGPTAWQLFPLLFGFCHDTMTEDPVWQSRKVHSYINVTSNHKARFVDQEILKCTDLKCKMKQQIKICDKLKEKTKTKQTMALLCSGEHFFIFLAWRDTSLQINTEVPLSDHLNRIPGWLRPVLRALRLTEWFADEVSFSLKQLGLRYRISYFL